MSGITDDELIADIKVLGHNFQKKVIGYPGGTHLCFKYEYFKTGENPGKTVKEYYETSYLYYERLKSRPIEYFASFFIRAILKFQPFSLDSVNDMFISQNEYIGFPNECFIIVLLEMLFRMWDNNYIKKLRLNREKKREIIKKLDNYKRNIESLEPIAFVREILNIKQTYFI